MNWYFAYARTGREFEVAAEISKLCECWCGRVMTFTRSGKKRRVEALTKPKLPNYLFLNMQAEVFCKVVEVRHLQPTFSVFTRNDVADFMKFKNRVDAEYKDSEWVVANSAVDLEQFTAGQELVELTGRFGNRCLTYHRMIQNAHDLYPKVLASMEMFGREVIMELDPLDVKAAE